MGQLNRPFALGRLFLARTLFLLSLSLIVAGRPVNAQTANGADHPACASPSQPPSQTKLNESLLPSSPEQPCAIVTKPETPAPLQPQTTLQNHRLFGVLADYTTVETSEQFGTLSAKTKFKLTAKTMTDPVTVSVLAGIALLGQARNTDPTYGQGFSGYDKRFATFYADTGIGTLMTSSVFPTVLHQDPRYFQLGQGGFRRRFLHAAGSIFVAHSDRGVLQFNYSQVVGNAVAAGISNTYHPQSQRTLGNTLNVWGTDTLLNMFCNVAKEFWPDLRRKLHKQKNPT